MAHLRRLAICAALTAFATGAVSSRGHAQEAAANPSLRQLEDSLVATADSMSYAPLPEDRLNYIYTFVRQLRTALSAPGSYNYPFDSLGKHINIITPDDRAFRIFNWSLALTDETRRYYGAIQTPDRTYGLVDHSAQIQKGVSDSILRDGRWFGALYYRIMPVETSEGRIYTLFGFNSANASSNRKVLDPLRITAAGPVFGAPIFGVRSPDTRNQAVRFVMEYKKGIQAALNWNAEMNAIFFDRLESEVNDPNRRYTFVPSGQYDGLRWENGQWRLVQDLIPITILQDGQPAFGGRD